MRCLQARITAPHEKPAKRLGRVSAGAVGLTDGGVALVGTGVPEDFYYFGLTEPLRYSQCRIAFIVCGMDVCAGVEQGLVA